MKMAVFWAVAPCSLVEVHQRFRGPCCLHHQGDDRDDTTQKTAIFRAEVTYFQPDIKILRKLSATRPVTRAKLSQARW
jgi:hypothetical protein